MSLNPKQNTWAILPGTIDIADVYIVAGENFGKIGKIDFVGYLFEDFNAVSSVVSTILAS